MSELPERSKTQPITVDNFCRAETDRYFKAHVANAGGIGRLKHSRAPVDVDHQTVIRANRDTLYSNGVFDLAAPLTVAFPDTGGRFMSLIVINEDHYIKLVTYDPGDYRLTAERMGTRYVQLTVRTFVDPDDPADLAIAHKLQDSIVIKQSSPGVLVVPNWDQPSLDVCRAAILGMGPFVPDSRRMFGDVDEVDEVRHLIGTAGGYAGNREEDALYLNVNPAQNDGLTPHVLTVHDVPVDGFWSVSLYNGAGFFEKNAYGAYSLNNVTAQPNVDGSYTILFGGDPQAKNFLYIMPGWNYTVRLYRPRPEVLDGSWVFPEAAPIK